MEVSVPFNKFSSWAQARHFYGDLSVGMQGKAAAQYEAQENGLGDLFATFFGKDPFSAEIAAVTAFEDAKLPYNAKSAPTLVESMADVLLLSSFLAEDYVKPSKPNEVMVSSPNIMELYASRLSVLEQAGLPQARVAEIAAAYMAEEKPELTDGNITYAVRLINPLYKYKPKGPGGASGMAAPKSPC